MDTYGNLMYAGWGSTAVGSSPTYPLYGYNNATKQGYIGLMNQYGVPYWIFRVKDNT